MPVEADVEVAFTISVRQQNIAELEKAALAVSTPGHPRYGKHRTVAQIEALTAPAQADVARVTAWLRSHGG